jgi:LAGLIDADG endonuclease
MDAKYLAGFFDGEGSVGLYYDKSNGRWRPRIVIVQNYSKAVEQMFATWAAEFDGHVYATKKTDQPSHVQLIIRSEKGLVAFLDCVRGHTRLKTRQLIVLAGWLASKKFSYRVSQILKSLKRMEA